MADLGQDQDARAHHDVRVRAADLRSNTLANICAPGAPSGPECFAATSLVRRDRYQRASAELDWTDTIVATVGYQLTVIDSNSYGQSLVRHRIMASGTLELVDRLFATVTTTLQLDQYPDSILIEKNIQHQEFTNLEEREPQLAAGPASARLIDGVVAGGAWCGVA